MNNWVLGVFVCTALTISGCGSLQPVSLTAQLQDLHRQGAYEFENAEYERAVETWQQGLELARTRGATRFVGTFLTNLGVGYANAGRYEKALSTQIEALAIKRQLGDRRGEAVNLTNIGDVYWSLGQYSSALRHFQSALTIHRRIQQRDGVAANLNNIGAVNAQLGNNHEAIAYSRQALRISRALRDDSGESANLNNIGVLQRNLGDNELAAASFANAMEIAVAVGDRRGQANSLGNLGLVHSEQGRLASGREALTSSEAILAELGAIDLLWKVQRGLGRVEVQSGDDRAAVNHYERALEHVEQLRAGIEDKTSQTTFIQGKLIVYDELIALYRNLHRRYPNEGFDLKALQIFERKQGRVFLEEIGKSGARRFRGLPEDVQQREVELDRLLQRTRGELVYQRSQGRSAPDLERKLDELRTEEHALRQKLQNKYPDYFALKYPLPASVQTLQSLLATNEVLLVYHVMPEDTFVWLITSDGHWFHELGLGQKDLEQRVNDLRGITEVLISAIQRREPMYRLRRIAQRTHGAWDHAARTLYQILLPSKLRERLSPGQLLYVVPTGPLYGLPFGTLVSSRDGRPARYLVSDHPVAYLSSSSLLRIIRQASKRRSESPRFPLLAFADPVYDDNADVATGNLWIKKQTQSYLQYLGGSFSRIPHSADNARALGRLLRAPIASGPLQLGERATRSRVLELNDESLLDDYRYVFFGVHGVLPGEVNRIVQPALVLSHPEQEGYLTMGDVFGLALNADLVTLSACNTARGEAVRGDGIRGLTRAFMYAGTQSVGATLWAVEAQSVQLVSEGLHAGLVAGLERAEALRRIKLRMLQGDIRTDAAGLYQHPYFWAPLVLFGEGA